MSQIPTATDIEIDKLLLDPNNPRLDPQYEFKLDEQDRILQHIAEEFHLDELFDSIVASGRYWQHEPLIAKPSGKNWIVLEGNRRLAAVKLLVEPRLQERISYKGVPPIDDVLRERLKKLPVIEGKPADVWAHIGFKHVNGAKQWDSIAKARYIERIHEQEHVPLDQIAKAIGDRNSTVRRLYVGLKVLNQAIETGAFDPDDRFNDGRPLAFTHLWTGLGYENTRDYLGVSSTTALTRKPVPAEKIQALRNYCRWLYGSKKDGDEPYVQSQNPHLRNLDEALAAPNGIAALEQGASLEKALNAAAGDKKLLRQSLEQAEIGMKDARGYFPKGFEGEENIAEQIKGIYKLARALRKDVREVLGEEDD
jgi:hypothetical protein